MNLFRLKTVEVLLRSLDEAESQVTKYESRLSEEDTVPADTAAIQNLKDQLQARTTIKRNRLLLFMLCFTRLFIFFIPSGFLPRGGRLRLLIRRASFRPCKHKWVRPKRQDLSSATSIQIAAQSWSATRKKPIRWQTDGAASRDRLRHGESDSRMEKLTIYLLINIRLRTCLWLPEGGLIWTLWARSCSSTEMDTQLWSSGLKKQQKDNKEPSLDRRTAKHCRNSWPSRRSVTANHPHKYSVMNCAKPKNEPCTVEEGLLQIFIFLFRH